MWLASDISNHSRLKQLSAFARDPADSPRRAPAHRNHHRRPPAHTPDMPIVEHAFSYGGLLIRTFRHADAAPPPPLPPHPSEPPRALEQPPPPKRQKRTPRTPSATPGTLVYALPGPSFGATPTDFAHAGDTAREPPTPASTDPSSERYAPEYAKPGETRYKPWVPASELERLRGGETEWQRHVEERGVLPPVRYMQETGCATDVDRFAVAARGETDCGPFYGACYDLDAGVGLQSGAEDRSCETGGGGYGQCAPVRSPLPRSAINEHGLYFSTSAAQPHCDIPLNYFAPPPPCQAVIPPVPTTLPPEPVPLPSPTDPTPKKGRGRPRKVGGPSKPTKPALHHCDTVSALLTHIQETIASAAADFIPRPLLVAYTLPIPPAESEFKSFAQSLVRGIAAVDNFQWAIAHSQWTTSKSNPTVGARWVCNLSEEVRNRAGGSYLVCMAVCVDYANSARTAMASCLRPKRYPCAGAITIRFSSAKKIATLRYSHHAVHSPPCKTGGENGPDELRE